MFPNNKYKELKKIIDDLGLNIFNFKDSTGKSMKVMTIQVIKAQRTPTFALLKKTIQSKLKSNGKKVEVGDFRKNKDMDLLPASPASPYINFRILVKPEPGSAPKADEHETLSAYCIANALKGSKDFSFANLNKLDRVDGFDLKTAYKRCGVDWLESSKRHGKFIVDSNRSTFRGKLNYNDYYFLQRAGTGKGKWVKALYNRFAVLKKREGIALNADKWDPADMWIVHKSEIEYNWGKFISLKELNGHLVTKFKESKVIGVSLKKCESDRVVGNIENVARPPAFKKIDKIKTDYSKVVNKFCNIKFNLTKGNDQAKGMTLVIRPFTNEEASGELKGVGSLAGKVGITEINRLFKEIIGKEVERKAEIIRLYNNMNDFYKLMHERYDKQQLAKEDIPSGKNGYLELQRQVNMKLGADVAGYYMGKFQAVSVCRMFDNISDEKIKNKIKMGMYSYASSTTENSGPFIKVSN